MRHTQQQHAQVRHGTAPHRAGPPADEGTPERMLRYWKVGQEVAGVASTLYGVGRAVAPYMAAAAAAL